VYLLKLRNQAHMVMTFMSLTRNILPCLLRIDFCTKRPSVASLFWVSFFSEASVGSGECVL
jgi:hypothetical protein